MKLKKTLNFFRQSYIIILLSLIYIPLIVIIFLSFTKPSIKGNITNSFDWNSGENYIELFKNNDFLNALANTAIIVVFVVPISTILATLTCFGIWNSKKFYQNTVLGVSKVNIVIPDVISGICLALLFSVTWISWFKSDLGFITIILAHISFCTPYAIILIFPRMQKMKRNLILASQDLGYSKFQTFFKVIIPFILPSILSAAAIVFGMSFDDFIITKLVGGKISTISTEMYTMAKGIKSWAVTFGAILVILSFVIVAIVAIKKSHKARNISKNLSTKKWTKKQKLY
ncbi:MAG: ABC transporter permease [Ureaplasma sp.]|nr:ABC transporter permease [Ureaplasma sp.]